MTRVPNRRVGWRPVVAMVSNLLLLTDGCAGENKPSADTAEELVPGGNSGIPVPGPCDPLGSCGWTDLSMAPGAGCGLRQNTRIDCWGDLDDFGRDDFSHGVGFTDVTLGVLHGCALRRDGLPVCWGAEGAGESDYGQADPPEVPFVAIEAGAYQTCGLDAGGFITCWGYWGYYHMGRVEPPGSFVQMDAGHYNGCALDAKGRVTCWGYYVNEGSMVSNPEGTYLRVACGMSCYGVASDGRLVSFGPRYNVVASPPAGERFMDVSVWGTLACGLTTAGELRCWGYSDPDSYAKGLSADWDTVTYPEGPFTKIGVSNYSVCAIRADGTISCMDSCGRPEYDAPYFSPYPGPCT